MYTGDDTVVLDLDRRVQEFDAIKWWKQSAKAQTPLQIQSKKDSRPDTAHLHNPYAGVRSAWQLTETVDEFLHRLPPATTAASEVGPWLFICNPYIARKSKSEGQNQRLRGCEDEAPEENETDLVRFCEGGMERLNLVTDFHEELNRVIMMPAMRAREKTKAALDASRDILGLAHALHVRSGKWMLFCSADAVNDAWATVATATANNALGVAAKVATKSEGDDRTEQLICVYTADFTDRDDVERVALKLKQLGLVHPRGKPLYYKPGQYYVVSAYVTFTSVAHPVADAYTYLGLGSGNTWGIKASIYNTKDIIGKV